MVKLKKKAGVSKRVRRQHTGALKREWHLPRCARTRQWRNCESKLDADDRQIHQDLRNWLSQHKETSQSVWKDIIRISAA